ncbi:MAG: hypothetical protein GY855_10755 [candidate division Zixibacteria bacterium]|nr:hypothetical protein [candidate division Zixibacteria bacterium]
MSDSAEYFLDDTSHYNRINIRALALAFKGYNEIRQGNHEIGYHYFKNSINMKPNFQATKLIGFLLHRPYPVFRITSNSFAERYPNFSPDNSQIAFIADCEQLEIDDGIFVNTILYQREIRIFDIADSSIITLDTEGIKGIINYVRFTPDGKDIIYTARKSSRGVDLLGADTAGIIYSYNFESGQNKAYTSKNTRGRAPLMTDNGKLIYTLRTINIYNPKNNKTHKSPWNKYDWPYAIDYMDYDDGLIAYRAFSERKSGIFLTDTLLWETKTITSKLDNSYYPAFKYREKIIAFITEEEGGDEIYFYSLEDASYTKITNSGGKKAYLSFSSDGTRILFCQKPLGKPDPYYDIYCIDTREPRRREELLAYLDSMININYEN